MTDDKREWARPVEEVARAISNDAACGLTYQGQHVCCDDIRLKGWVDGYGESLWHADCSCRSSAVAAINTLRRLGMIHEDGLKAIREEERK